MNEAQYQQMGTYGFCFMGGVFAMCLTGWRAWALKDEELEHERTCQEAEANELWVHLSDEVKRLQRLRFDYEKAGKKLNPAQIRLGEKYAAKSYHTLTEEQRNYVDWYHEQIIGTGQRVEIIEPPDEPGDWKWNADENMFEVEGGRRRSRGKVTTSSPGGRPR